MSICDLHSRRRIVATSCILSDNACRRSCASFLLPRKSPSVEGELNERLTLAHGRETDSLPNHFEYDVPFDDRLARLLWSIDCRCRRIESRSNRRTRYSQSDQTPRDSFQSRSMMSSNLSGSSRVGSSVNASTNQMGTESQPLSTDPSNRRHCHHSHICLRFSGLCTHLPHCRASQPSPTLHEASN